MSIYGGRHRTRASAVIDRNNVVAEYTAPELALKEIFGKRIDKPNPIPVEEDDGQVWTLKPDFWFIRTNVICQVDGAYHQSRRIQAKDAWEDACLNERNWRVIRIDSDLLTTKKHWPYVKDNVERFLLSSEPVKRLAA